MQHLNNEQKRAVTTTEGRILALAGAGSGKTTVLMERIAYLVRTKRVPPESIVALTYTNKAALEMRQRLERYGSVRGAVLSTFHSFALQHARVHYARLGLRPRFSIYSAYDSRRLFQRLIRDYFDTEGDLPPLKQTLSLIEQARRGAFAWDALPTTATHRGLIQTIWPQYQQSLLHSNALDFDGLLESLCTLLDEGVLPHYRYIMVDEYQDTNDLQEKIACTLAKRSGNLFVVGDDDQSIYSWRGASVHRILGFQADSVIKLVTNYRCSAPILACANTLIRHNQERSAKELHTHRTGGELVRICVAPTDEKEALVVVQQLLGWRHQYSWSKLAVLYRSNILARPLEKALLQAQWYDTKQRLHQGIPYQTYGGESLFDRSEVRDVVRLTRWILNPEDDTALSAIMNWPRRGVGPASMQWLLERVHEESINLEAAIELAITTHAFPASVCDALALLLEDAQWAREALQAPGELTQFWEEFLERFSIQKAIHHETKSEAMRRIRWENVRTLIDPQLCEGARFDALLEQIGRISIDTGLQRTQGKEEEHVSLMTFHSSKGLEFDAVIVVGLEDGICPHEKVEEDGREEERRLLYVAMTRARTQLLLTCSQQRGTKQTKPSPYLRELPSGAFRVQDWQLVASGYVT